MQTKSAAWWAALQAPAVAWRYGLDILAQDENTPLENVTLYDQNASDRLVPTTAQIDLDATAKTHRQFKLALRNSDGRYLPGVAGAPSGGAGSPRANGLVWYNVRYRPWMDLRTGYDAKGNPQYDRTYLGVYVLVNPETQVKTVGSQALLALLDKSALLCKPYLITAGTLPTFSKGGHTVGGYAAGSTFDSVMGDLATRAGIPARKQLFAPSALTLPADYTIKEGDEWWTHLQTLAGSMAHVIYFDGVGNLVRRPDPLLQPIPSAFTFRPGPLSIVSAVDRKTDLAKTYNHVIVLGGSSTTGTYRGEAQVQDPASPYHKNAIGDRVVPIGKDGKLNDWTPDPAIGSAAQANTVAQVRLAGLVGQQESVQITARNIPALEPYDKVTVNVAAAGVSLDFRVMQLSWKLDHGSGGGMTVQVDRWFNAGS